MRFMQHQQQSRCHAAPAVDHLSNNPSAGPTMSQQPAPLPQQQQPGIMLQAQGMLQPLGPMLMQQPAGLMPHLPPGHSKVRACAALYLLLPGRRRAGAPEAPATGLAAFDMCQRHQQQFTVGVQQCLPVTAAFAFMRVAGGPHSVMHVSAVTFFQKQMLSFSGIIT
jgi:hypothetical protein